MNSVILDLGRIVGDRNAIAPTTNSPYLFDATEARGLHGHADAVVCPGSAEEVAGVVAWSYERGIAIVPRGGGTGFAGGAVPSGGVVLALERLHRVRSFDPLLWRMEVEAGARTLDIRRTARASGLLFPPDPGAAEQSQIGGNIATNAGGPHAFKYGVTGAWVTGLEVVVAPGEIVSFGGPIRKDVSTLDLKSLFIGSEGTLGIITAAWLRLAPAPEVALPIAAFYADTKTGCAAIEAMYGNGLVAAALEYLDAGTLALAGATFPGGVPDGAGFLVIAEADGTAEEARRLCDEMTNALAGDAIRIVHPEPQNLWRWRDGVSIAVTAALGGKVSEDIVVPVDRLADAIDATVAIGVRHGLQAVSWGHGGDGNLHSTFLLSRHDSSALEKAERAADDLFTLAIELGGSISGEHGLGVVKRGHAGWNPRVTALHTAIKQALDPKGLFNPGKKL